MAPQPDKENVSAAVPALLLKVPGRLQLLGLPHGKRFGT
jgi:hypothetical protein